MSIISFPKPSKYVVYLPILLMATSVTGAELEYTYDELNRLTQYRDSCGNEFNYTYDFAGNLESKEVIAGTLCDAVDSDEPPTAVAALVIDQVTVDSVTIEWQAANDDIQVEHYQVYRDIGLLDTTTRLSFEEIGLLPDTDYSYNVVAVDSSGQEGPVTSVSARTLPEQPELAPVSDLRGEVYSSTAVEIFWTAGPGHDATTTYEIYRDDELVENRSGRSYFDSSLASGTRYDYSVIAVSGDGESERTSISLTTSSSGTPPTDSGKPSIVASLTGEVYSNTGAEIFWEPATDDGWIVGYEIYRDDNFLEIRNGRSYYDDAIQADVAHIYTVIAVDNDDNQGPAATYQLGQEDEAIPPGPPSAINELTYAIYSSTAAELFWKGATDDSFVVGYKISRNGQFVEQRDGRSYFDSTLEPDIVYTYSVWSVDNEGNEGPETSVSFSTADKDGNQGRPSRISNLRGQVYSRSAVELF